MSISVAHSFNQAAFRYDKYASLQKRVAEDLSFQLLGETKRSPSILEIGCGTGFLTDILKKKLDPALYIATDFAPSMVESVCLKLSLLPNIHFIVMDGENIATNFKTDWVVSNLAFQWFANLEASLQKIWSQTNMLAFTTILSGSLYEWDLLCNKNGFKSGLRPFVKEQDLLKICQQLEPDSSSFKVDAYTENFESPWEFLKNLKNIGAHSPRKGYIPISLQKLVRSKIPFKVTYQIATCILEK
jgi:malonyl-CoA O-methyltransferase